MPAHESMGDTLSRLRGLQSASETWKKKRHEKIRAAGHHACSVNMDGPTGHHKSLMDSRVEPPADVIADRDRRALIQPTTITAALMGDPPVGRSALDKRKPKLVVAND